MRTGRPRQDEEERFWSKVREADSGCWEWQDVPNQTNGYGQFRLAGYPSPRVYAHRYAYEIVVGKIPEGLQIDHLCRNRICVNPAHLEAVTDRENKRRTPVVQSAHCKRGHAYAEHGRVYRTTYERKRGGTVVTARRSCTACKRERRREARLSAELGEHHSADLAAIAGHDVDTMTALYKHPLGKTFDKVRAVIG